MSFTIGPDHHLKIDLTVTLVAPGPSPAPTLADLQAWEALMSMLSEKLALNTAAIATLTAHIVDIQALIASGGASPADFAVLDQQKTDLDAANAAFAAVTATPAAG
jgi:hypothetical protein